MPFLLRPSVRSVCGLQVDHRHRHEAVKPPAVPDQAHLPARLIKVKGQYNQRTLRALRVLEKLQAERHGGWTFVLRSKSRRSPSDLGQAVVKLPQYKQCTSCSSERRFRVDLWQGRARRAERLQHTLTIGPPLPFSSRNDWNRSRPPLHIMHPKKSNDSHLYSPSRRTQQPVRPRLDPSRPGTRLPLTQPDHLSDSVRRSDNAVD